MAEQDAVVGAGRGKVPYESEGRFEGGGVGQVEAGESEPGGGGVHVRVGERGSDQGAVQIDNLVDPVREGVGGPFGTDPGDLSTLHDHRGGEGIGGAVNLSSTEQDGLGHDAGLTHGEQSRASPGRRRTQVRQILGGRASYGVDSTTVVRVDTPASERSQANSSSSSCGVATRTLRM